ncbi:MAG: DMT family transporter [Clostridiaceae bacterium]
MSRIKIIIAMLIFGSIGVFVKSIQLTSLELAFLRAAIASFFIGWVLLIIRKKDRQTNDRLSLPLLASGICLGFNWVLLFEAYKYTTIGKATMSYYFAPFFIFLLAPIVFKERLDKRKLFYILGAMIGLVLVVDIGGIPEGEVLVNVKGIAFGIAAAALYAGVVIFNKFIVGVSDFYKTFVQLVTSALVLIPFVAFEYINNIEYMTDIISSMDIEQWILVITVGIIHTGVSYLLYFSSLKELKAQSAAILSFIDPISAVIFAAIFLKEGMNLTQISGGIIVLACTYFCERAEEKD